LFSYRQSNKNIKNSGTGPLYASPKFFDTQSLQYKDSPKFFDTQSFTSQTEQPHGINKLKICALVSKYPGYTKKRLLLGVFSILNGLLH